MPELPPVESSTVGAIYAAYEANHEDKERFYLGLSGLETDCDRRLYYGWRKCHAPERFDGRKLRLFQTGHREEARMIEDLRAAGVTVDDVDPETGKQWEVKAIGGHVSGHLDGRAVGIVEAPKAVHVTEFKTHKNKSFAKLLKEGVEVSKPGHFRQTMSYMHLTGWDRAFYMAHNKDDDALYVERISYDPIKAMQIMNRLERIVRSDTPPQKLHEDPSSKLAFLCHYCPAFGVCHEDQFSRSHCRTCLHATPIVDESTDARWRCELHNHDLTIPDQMTGCPSHLFIPDLVPGEQIDAAEDGAWVEYRLHDGSTWRDGPEGYGKAVGNKTRYFYHPESNCAFTTDDGSHPTDGLVEEITEEQYVDILSKGDTA